MTPIKQSLNGMGRRNFLLSGAAGVAMAGLSTPSVFAQSAPTASTLLLSSIATDSLKSTLEKVSKVKVDNGPFLSTTDTIARLMAPNSEGRFDVMMALSEIGKGPILGEKAGQERAIALDPALVPNMSQVADLHKSGAAERDGRIYAIPFYAGFDSVVYNKDAVPANEPLLDSWGLIFSEKYAGRIAWQDDPYYTPLIAGIYLGLPNPQDADRKQVEEIAKFLISKKKLVRAMWTTPAQQISLMGGGEVVVMHGQVPPRVALKRRGVNVANNWPKEGLLVWNGHAFVPKTSRNQAAAQAVINALLSGEYGAALTRESGYMSTSKLAEAQLSAAERTEAAYDVGQRGIKVVTYARPKDYNLWLEAWARVKSA